MCVEPQHSGDPRWGQEHRERKAEAIYRTLDMLDHRNWTESVWLDIGCGSGGIASTIAPRVRRMIGIDPEAWRRWADFLQRHDNLEFHAASYREIEAILGRDRVDVVICNQVYEHVDDPSALLRAIYAVLKADGICYFAGPNLLWPIEPHVFWPFVHWLPRQFARRMMRILGSKRAHELDAWSWSYWRLMRNFREAGFEAQVLIRERLLVEVARPRLRRILRCVPSAWIRCLAPFAPGFVFALRKRGAPKIENLV
jgi:SAM-dependent methyltransferase